MVSCHPGLSIIADFPHLCPFFTDLFELAGKYNLQQLKKEIEALFKTQCEVHTRGLGSRDVGTCHIPLLRPLLANPDAAPPLRDILLDSLRDSASKLQEKSQSETHKFWRALQADPELCLLLLATGGLDGKACKIMKRGNLSPPHGPERKISTSDAADAADGKIPREKSGPKRFLQ